MRHHPFAVIIAAVRQRARVRRLDAADTRRCIEAARENYGKRQSVGFAITAGQRMADTLGGRKGLGRPLKLVRS